jgi:hypothetical protein
MVTLIELVLVRNIDEVFIFGAEHGEFDAVVHCSRHLLQLRARMTMLRLRLPPLTPTISR